MRKNRMLSLLLALSLALAVPAAAYGPLLPQKNPYTTPFADTVGTWCESYVEIVYEAGLMEGKTADRFDAAAPLTHAQIVAVCARLHDLLAGGDGQIDVPADGAWYQGYYQALWSQMEGKELFIPFYLDSDLGYTIEANTPCTREEFVRTISYALLNTGVEFPELNAVSVLPDVCPSSEFGSVSNVILEFYRAGILTGSDTYGTFQGDGLLNRGQAAAILARLVDPDLREVLQLKTFDLCREVIGLEPGTVLAVIDGMEITADQASMILAYSDSPDAVINRLCRIVAMLRLVQEKALSWNLEAGEAAYERIAGYRGVSAKGWAWQMMDYDLFEQLNGAPMDPHAAADGFYDALYAEIDAVEAQLPVESTGILDEFDFAALSVRLDASPF